MDVGNAPIIPDDGDVARLPFPPGGVLIDGTEGAACGGRGCEEEKGFVHRFDVAGEWIAKTRLPRRPVATARVGFGRKDTNNRAERFTRPGRRSDAGLGNPLEQLSGLEVKEFTEGVERVGVQSTKLASRTGKPVGAGIADVGPFAERVGGDVPPLHDLVDAEPNHRDPSEGPR